MASVWMAVGLAACGRPAPQEEAVRYPDARREDHVDTYFGQPVPDPYRWLEDPDSAETRAWVAAENALTDQVLGDGPERRRIRERLTERWSYERFGLPTRTAGKLLFEHNDGLQNQNELRVIEGDGAARTLLDANAFSTDGTVPLTTWRLSEDGRYLAYGTSDGGSDWTTLAIRDLTTGADLPERLRWVKFSRPAWSPDGSGFWYSRYPEPTGKADAALANQAVYFHRPGTDQADDALVLALPDDPKVGFDVRATDDGAWLVATLWRGTEEKSRVWVRPLAGAGDWIRLLDAADAQYTLVDHDGDRFWFWTDRDAPRGRLVEIDLRRPEPAAWRTLVPESADLLEGVSAVGDRFFATWLHDARSRVEMFDLEGRSLGEVPLPGIGTARGFDGRLGDPDVFFSFESYTTPPSVLRYDLATGEVHPFGVPSTAFDGSAYVTEQVFYTSADGARIPMFLVHRADAPRDGDRPTLLYGYGGFNIPKTPEFLAWNAVWLEMGGVFALANLRGGGEYGREWHEAGTRLHKQRVFDDAIAAAEHLCTERWTRPARLALHGRSNGGLLVGATLVQRPDLFGAAVPMVGVLDMLKYHTWTIGWGWASDYGTSEESEEMFRALLAYSPVHNARPAEYPPTLILTGDHDDRVVPAHSFKFAAALQRAQQGPAPILARIDTRAGHGAGKSTAMAIDERADMLWFLARSLGMPVDLP